MEGGACKSDTARSTADVVVESRRGSKSAVVVERRPRYSAADVVEKGKRDYRAYYTRETSLSPFITFPLWFLAFIMGVSLPTGAPAVLMPGGYGRQALPSPL